MGVRGSPHRYEFEQVLRKGRGKSDQFSIPNSQFPSEKTVETEPFPRMRIENWELRIGQIPSPLSQNLLKLIPVCAAANAHSSAASRIRLSVGR